MSKLREKMAARDNETRIYKITGEPRLLNDFEEVLSMIQYLGNVGASRTIQLGIDGDGSVRLKIERINDKGKEIDMKEKDNMHELLEKDNIDMGLC